VRRFRNLHRSPNSMLTRDKGKDLLLPWVEDFFLPAIQTGINMMALLTPMQRRPLSKRSLAGMLNDYIVDDVIRRFDGVKEVAIDNDCGFWSFGFGDGAAALRIKKVNRDGHYRNYPTPQQVDLLYQRFLTGMGNPTQVVLGYRLDSLWRNIEQVDFICWNGHRRHWAIPVNDDLQAYLPAIAAEEAATSQKRLVTPKQNQKKRRAKGG